MLQFTNGICQIPLKKSPKCRIFYNYNSFELLKGKLSQSYAIS